ncbi:PP2C family protein-serine/threonine phosphatase [Streptomyces sp. NPDC005438]|uniref:PP2C family protein-serine/threonine phosphatase n=1 Tax=Streptomyces sp. NPDC005438 TaxID=3156880 RepID=UPI0033BC7CA6
MEELGTVQRALRNGPPDAMVDTVTRLLRQECGALHVELRMADYSVRALQTVHSPTTDPVTISDSPQGRAFEAPTPLTLTDPVSQTVTSHIPVSVRGDRIGVLSVTLPPASDAEALTPQLTQLCEVLGHEITVAERDTDLYLRARRAARLTLAAEMQWQLLPSRTCVRREFVLGGHLEPAYAIRGDNFDWSATADQLTLALTNGMGEGIRASLLTNLAVNAMRNARRAGLDLAEQATLTNEAVCEHYRGEEYVSMLLLRFELDTGKVEVLDAGSPRAWLRRDGRAERLDFDAQPPMGRSTEVTYTTERFQLRPGDRLVMASDGVYDSDVPSGERFGDRALARSLAAHRLLPATQVPRALLRELSDYREGLAIDDDALVACVDWHGRGDEPGPHAPGQAE